jgi:hypothetical protein
MMKLFALIAALLLVGCVPIDGNGTAYQIEGRYNEHLEREWCESHGYEYSAFVPWGYCLYENCTKNEAGQRFCKNQAVKIPGTPE